MRPRARRARAILRDRRRGCWGHPIGGQCHNCFYDRYQPMVYYPIAGFDLLLARLYAGDRLKTGG